MYPQDPFPDGTRFFQFRLISANEYGLQASHAGRMSCVQCDLTELLEESRPPDAEMLDLIEKAFLEGQIDGLTAELAHIFLIWHLSLAMMT